jgi:uncharacterized protein with NAD-binding domain and iron-sulfur cluster
VESHGPVEVAVIGSGCAAMTAAFELTRPEHGGRYRVTVYQQGWRLGGKGASGRGPADRIEEHGLHIWMGFYENAFRVVRECYAELGRDPATCRIADWSDAFFPDPMTGVVDDQDGDFPSHWLAYFPPGAGTPGDPGRPADRFSMLDYLVRSTQLLGALLRSVQDRTRNEPPDAAGSGADRELAEQIGRWLRYGQLAGLAGVIQGVRLLEGALVQSDAVSQSVVMRLMDAVATACQSWIETMAESDTELRRLWDIVELVLVILRGSLRFRLAVDPRGFDAIADYDWREWLRINGASERTLVSPFLHSLYDLAFAYEDGDRTRPAASASEALRCAVRAFLTYRGSFFWKMRAGMGDVVFAPLYEVLKRRGVRFRFFHRLENVGIGEDADGQAYVRSLDFDVQARIATGGEYQPLVDVRGLPCWPSSPDFAQLEDGERMQAEGWRFECWWDRRKVDRLRLEVSRDFDFVVLGVGLGAIPHVCPEILARDERWRAMVEHVKTTATQALQLWLDEPVEALGWNGPPINITGFDGYFETWADMRYLAPEETWPAEPAAIAYFCSSLQTPPEAPDRSESTHPGKQHERVREESVRFLDRDIARLWPRASRDGRFRWELLSDPERAGAGDRPTGPERLDTQYWRANVSPTDRYTLSLPGSSRHRISPLDRTYDNLTLAGDWTACGLDIGCVEAAAMSGRLAAHAISGSPALAEITGYDHP